MRIAAVATHPIQYQAPVWRLLAADPEVDLHVFFASRHGLEPYHDAEFGQKVAWDIPLVDGYSHEFCPSVRLPGFRVPVAKYFPRGLRRGLNRRHYDAVLVHGYATWAAWAALGAAASTRTPVILRGESHDVGRPTPAGLARAKDALLGQLLPRVRGVLAIGTWNREYWIRRGAPPERVETALYCVDNTRLASTVQQRRTEVEALRASWGIGPDEVGFIYVAKLVEKKCPELLIRAMSQLPESRRKLVMVGSGPLEARLKELARQLNVPLRLTGIVNQRDIPLYYAAADVKVLPSRFEPWGLVVNEAMACGTPCIVSDRVAAGADLVANCNTGMIFEHDNADDLARCLHLALEDNRRKAWKERLPGVVDSAHPRHFVAGLKRLLDDG